MNNNFNHFQKTYIGVLADVLRDRNLNNATDRFDYTEAVNEQLCYLADCGSYCEFESQVWFDERLCEKLAGTLGLDDQKPALLTAITDAKKLTREKNLSETYRVANDFGEGSEMIRAFISDGNRRELMYGVDTGYTEKAFAFFKLRFNEQIDFLYGAEYSDRERPLSAKQDMKYLGFYNKADGEVYCLVDPLDKLYDIHNRNRDDSMSSVKARAINAVRCEVANRIAMTPPFVPDNLPMSEIQTLSKEAEEIYGKGGAISDFAEKVYVNEYLISPDTLVRFIIEGDSLVKEIADKILSESGVDLTRRWAAHQVLQRILDNIASDGSVPLIDGIHKPMALPLWKMDGKPAFVVANSAYNCVCAWKILRQQGPYIMTENAPFDERTYGKHWVAFDHEPPREVILEWQTAHQEFGGYQ